jgi:hypothetical protein
VAVGAAVLVGGCATAPDEQPTPLQQANRTAERQVDRAVERGYDASEDLSSYTVRIRYNPPRCDAPAFEAYLYGRWTRVYLEAGRKQRDRIDAIEEEAQPLGTRTVEGVPTGWRRAETDVRYRTFYVESFEP